MRRVGTSWSSLGAAVALATAVSACGAAAPMRASSAISARTSTAAQTSTAQTSTTPAVHMPAGASAASLGALAGYARQSDTTAVGARWTVPTIATTSHNGFAGTWIGAQGPGPSGAAPFIQIGSNEDRVGGVDQYTAFWSDTTRHFHPVTLFTVAPGDRIAASMRLAAGHWMLSIRDTVSGAHDRVRTTQEAAATFDEGQWFQEDVTDSRTGRTFGYPQLSRVHFSHLTFGGRRVDDGTVESQWMTLGPHRDLAPSALRDSAFVLRPQTLGAAARRYLRLVAPGNQALVRLNAQIENPAAATLAARLRSSAAALSRALTTADTELARAHWPSAAQRDITALIAASRKLIALLPTLPRGVMGQSDGTETRFARAAAALTVAGHAVRQALDAPDLP